MSAKTKPAPTAEPAQSLAVSGPAAQHVDVPKAMTALQFAQSFEITSASDSAKGQEASQRLNGQIAALDSARKDITRDLDALKQKWMNFFGTPIAKYKEAKQIIDAKVVAWDDEQKRLARIEQAKRDREAQDERDRLQRIADEARRKAEAEAAEKRRQADEAAAAGRAEEAAKLQAQAARVEEKALDKAENFEMRAASVVAPVVQADTVRVAGSQFREIPDWEITDAAQINPAYLCPDETKIGKLVKALGLEAPSVVGAGLKVTMKKILASRRT